MLSPPGPSVNSSGDVFHHPVELFWLVSINVVRGIVYHLRGGQEIGVTESDEAQSFYNTERREPSDMNAELGALVSTHQHFGVGLLPDPGHCLPR